MKHKAISIIIVGIWVLSVVAIIARDNISPASVALFALGNTLWLAGLGFRAPKYPGAE